MSNKVLSRYAIYNCPVIKTNMFQLQLKHLFFQKERSFMQR